MIHDDELLLTISLPQYENDEHEDYQYISRHDFILTSFITKIMTKIEH